MFFFGLSIGVLLSTAVPPSLPRPLRCIATRKIFTLLSIISTVSLWCAQVSRAQETFTGTFTFGANGDVASFDYNGTPIPGLTVSPIAKVGVTTSSSSGNFRASGWPVGATSGSDVFTGDLDPTKYIEFTITAADGKAIDLPTLNFGIGRSGTGTRQWQWRSSADNYAAAIPVATANAALMNEGGVLTNPDSNSNWAGNSIQTSGGTFENVKSITFRLYSYNAETTSGTAGLHGPLVFGGTLRDASANAPSIASFAPQFGLAGTPVTITGTNLTGATVVSFGGQETTVFTIVDSTRITLQVPVGAQTGKIALTTPEGTASSRTDFFVGSSLPPVLTINPPVVSGLQKTEGSASTTASYSLVASNLTGSLVIGPTTNAFEISTNNINFEPSLTLPAALGALSNTIYVRIAASASVGPLQGAITNSIVDSGTSLTNLPTLAGTVRPAGTPGLIYWDFDTATPTSGVPAGWDVESVTRGNNNGTTPLLTTGSVSSGYTTPFGTNASGSFNAGAAARTGDLNVDAEGSAYFEVKLVAPAPVAITNFSFGSRSTSTGPTAYALRSSADDFASDLATNSLTTNWTMRTLADVSIPLSAGTNIIRIYGYSGVGTPTAGTANWRIDDLTLAVGAGGPVPTVGVSTNSLSGFLTSQGAASPAKSFNVSGTNLTQNITVTAPANYEVSLTENGDYSGPVPIPQVDGVVVSTPVFVRIAASASTTGPVTGNVQVTSLGATRTVSLSGTINALPPDVTVSKTELPAFSTTQGTASGVETFTVAGIRVTSDLILTAPTGFEISSTGETPWSSTLTLSPQSGTIAQQTISVRISAAARPPTVQGDVTIRSTGVSKDVLVTGTVIATATIIPSKTELPLITMVQGQTSQTQSFNVGGNTLLGIVTVQAPTPFVVSFTEGSGYVSSLDITPGQSGNISPERTVYVRIAAGTAAGSISPRNISLSGGGAAEKFVAVSGRVDEPAPLATITRTPPELSLVAIEGEAAPEASFTVSAANVGAGQGVTVEAPTNYQVSLDQSGWASFVSLTASGGVVAERPVYVRLTAKAPGSYVQQLSLRANNANGVTTTVTLRLNGAVVPKPVITVEPSALDGFVTVQSKASTNQTFKVSATNVLGDVTLEISNTAPTSVNSLYEISTNAQTGFASRLVLPAVDAPVEGAPQAAAATPTVIASDNAGNYGTEAQNNWTDGANEGTGFGPWQFIISDNSSGAPPPPYYAGAFIGNPVSAGITGFPAPAFGLYANPGGTPAEVTLNREFAVPLEVGDTFSFEWATNWDSDAGNKGFSIFAGTTEVVNVNQAGLPGDITLNGANTGLVFDTGPMTWTFTVTSAGNLRVTSTARNGSSAPVFTTDVAIPSAPTSFRWYVSAMGPGDQRQPYFNNLQITSSGGGSAGKIVPETTIYARIAANALAESPQTTETVAASVLATSEKADPKTVTLEGVVDPRPQPVVDVTGTNFNYFAAQAGVPSSSQVMAVGGSNLWTAITVDAQSPFVVSANSAGGFNSQAVLTPDANEVVASTNVYVRFAPAADAPAGVVTNSISVSSAPASPQSFNVAGRVYPANVSGPQGAIDFIAAPLGWFSTTTNTPSAPQAFYVSAVGLTQNLLVTAPDGFEVSPFSDGPYDKNVDFMLPLGGSTASGQLYVRLAQSSTPGMVFGDLVLSSGGATLAAADLQGTVFGKASGADAVVTPAALMGFSAAVGNPSASQAFTLAARGLTTPALTLAASAGYEISTDGGTAYGTTASLTATADGGALILPPENVLVRLSATASPGLVVAGTVSVTNGTPPTALATVTLAGSVAGAPTLNVTSSFVRFLGVKTPPDFPVQTFTVEAAWLTQNLLVTAPANFQVSLNGNTWASSVAVVPGGNPSTNTGGVVSPTTVSMRIAPTAPNGAVSGDLIVASSRQVVTRAVQGTVYATPPPSTIAVSPANLSSFSTTAGIASAPQSLTVNGINLSGPVTVSASAGFMVDRASIAPTAGVVEDIPVAVTVAANAPAGLLAGEIVLQSAGAASVVVKVNATVLGDPGRPAQSFDTGTGPSGAPTGTKPTVFGMAADPSNLNGLFYIAGNFTTYGGVKAPGIARLRADGSIDTTFDPGTGPNAPILSIVVQPDGKVLLVGEFTRFNGQTAGRVVRLLSDGKLDPSFQPGRGAAETVRAISVQWDGKILVGGDFEQFNGQSANFLVRLMSNGATDPSFRTGGDFGPNGPVYGLALDSGARIYIGGWFGGVDGLQSNRIARLLPDGKFDPTFNVRGGVGNDITAANQDPYRTGTVTSGLVNAIVVTQSGRVIVGGDFNTVGGRPGLAYRLAAFGPNGDPVRDFNNRARTDGEVTSLAMLPDGRIAVGGTFTFLDFQWNPGLAIINEGGVPDPTFFAPANAGQTLGLQALAVLPNGNLLYGGDFNQVNGATQSGVGMMYTTTGLEPLISSATELTGTVGAAFTYQITTTAMDPSAVTYTWKAASGSALPPGLVLQAGVISGTPTKAGIYRFTLTATNPAGSSTATLTLTVTKAPAASASAPATETKVTPAPAPAPQPPVVQVRAGRYIGLLGRAVVNRQNGGLLDLTVKANRSVLGTVVINGHQRTFSGTLGRTGRFQAKTKALKGQPLYDIQLGYVATAKAGPRIAGVVAQGARRAAFTANLSPWSAAQPATKLAGRYHAALQAKAAPARSAAVGGGVMALTVQPSGAVRLQGQLADGKSFTWSGRLGADGVVPVHVPMAGGTVLDGTLQLRNGAVQGSLLWVSTRPAAKWRVALKVQGGVYRAGTEARRVLGAAVPGGRLALTVAGGPLPRKTTAAVTVAKDGKLAGAAPVALAGGRFDPRTGLFSGRFNAGGSRTAAGRLHAVWIPRLGAAYGFVSWPAGSAPVTLRPPAKR